MKHKKLTLLILTVVFVLSLAVLCGCSALDTPQREHEHTFAMDWTYDEISHWRIANCGHSDVSDETKHTFYNGTCSACGYVEGTPLHTHSYSDDWTSDETSHWHIANCEHKNEVDQKDDHVFDVNGDCKVCGYHIHVYSNRWTTNATNHWHTAICEHGAVVSEKDKHTFANGKCFICGYIQDGGYQPSNGYTRSEDGKYIYFGEYPQSQVTDEAIIASLNWEAGDLPTRKNAQDWTDYRYYVRDEAQSYMWYIDIGLNGAKYRGVYFVEYRPWWICNSFSSDFTYQDENGYYTDTVYWFKYEPIRWRILSQTNGTAFLMCDSIVDSQSFQNTYYFEDYYYYVDSYYVPEGPYANNYQFSAIRRWLNNDFYNTAFSEAAQQLILTTKVDNSESTTLWEDNPFACRNTYDKVFLLSWQDVLNSDYGFNSDYTAFDSARQLKTSAYAQSQGAATLTEKIIEKYELPEYYRNYLGAGKWWLRSPAATDFGFSIGSVTYVGDKMAHAFINTDIGVVPALQIKL